MRYESELRKLTNSGSDSYLQLLPSLHHPALYLNLHHLHHVDIIYKFPLQLRCGSSNLVKDSPELHILPVLPVLR